MLFVMLVVGVGPTLGMHFCGQKLHSVDILSKQESCCGQRVVTYPESSDNLVYAIDYANCCDTKEVQLSTDNFQLQDRQLTAANILPSFESIWIVLFSTIFELASASSLTTALNDFPPGGYDVKDLDVLSFICTLRI